MTLAALFLFVLVLASSTTGFGREWNLDRARAYWFWTLIGFAVAFAFPNPWLGGLLAVMLIRLMSGPPALDPLKKIDDIVLIAAAACLLIPFVTVAVVPAVLWAIVLSGLWLTVYSVVSYRHFDPVKGYTLAVPFGKSWHFRFYEYQSAIAGGQGNPNHLHGLSATAIAACLGLEVIGQPLGTWLLPLCAIPMFISQFVKTDNPGHQGRPQQGWAHLLVLVLAWVPLLIGPWGWLGIGSVAVAISIILWRNRKTDVGLDSGRGKIWSKMIAVWWKSGWIDRLFGWGAKSFETHYMQAIASQEVNETKHFIVAHHPHSEYVCTLVETGIVGLVCLVGYLLTTLWALMQAGPTGWALYGVGVTLCSIAFISFPFSFYHELVFRIEGGPPGQPQQQARMFTLGSPGLFAISLAVLVAVEAVLRAN